ncbi:hypothetical protein I6J71_11880 [Amycolatopsis sp. FDAARGOS 1241]|nr:hypothetical protein I6J71_11880 [Amycolatopsis sp. FDAARGOS 1241]
MKHLLPVLCALGRSDLAVTAATHRDRPGWGIWRDCGFSTLSESWDETARSRNHYFLGSASAWIQQSVGGLRATSPGRRSLEIAPLADDRVHWSRITHTTVRGRVAVSWPRSGPVWTVEAEVPDGAVATLRLPGHDPRPLSAGRHTLEIGQRRG